MKSTKQSYLPKQAAPVQRPSTSVALSNQHGVHASALELSNLFEIYSQKNLL